MKLKSNKKGNYARLKRKAFFQMLLITVTAAGTVLLLRVILRGQIGDRIVLFLINTFYLDNSDAQIIYHYVFRNNLNIILLFLTLFFLVILSRFSIFWFTKYFDEVSSGMDRLVEDSEDRISLSPEMDFMENRLNTIKDKLKRQKKAAQEAEQRKNDLVVYLAHDIRTPLTSVIGYLSLLDEAPDMPMEQRAKYTHITLDKAYRLEKQINEFFEITRYNLQQIKLEKETIDLYYMLVQMTDEFYPILSEKGNTTVLHADENLTVYGDPVKLARVFNNILKNAAAYSYPTTEIVISAEEIKGYIKIVFQNQGHTIPPDKLAAIFEKFYRLDEARTSDTGGSGLGLSIAKEIVTLHGGAIMAQSKDNTVTFTVSLPVKH
ncbi:HAMP domain-containing histidine kinase [Paenibacillus mesophilus]|uniref:vancomycin resistance histidine kinase VanS n=1 Tax=Paenibacillus mesophilus TaxID=2582849 RepID=UPI00110EB091|nr:vancomycin resistance histidine kinase VanS [Paenibacillus mesophilus]TMV43265.1 HAMP domain-containing histidine kinase [Paenibacillus mesophilus]